ncbi:MAG: hypothetical protein ACRDS9_08155 [Pseudonocardiaceae bacterium]
MFVEFRRSGSEFGSIAFDRFQRLVAGTEDVGGLPAEVESLLDMVRNPDHSIRVALATHEECRTHLFSYRGRDGAALIAVKRGLLRLVPAQRPFLAADLAGSVNLRPQPEAPQAVRPTSMQLVTDLTSLDHTDRGQALDQARAELAWRVSLESQMGVAPLVAVETRNGLLVAADDGERLEPRTSTWVFRKVVEFATELDGN